MGLPAWVDAVVLELAGVLTQAGWQIVTLLLYLGILAILAASVAYVAFGFRLVWLMERVRNNR